MSQCRDEGRHRWLGGHRSHRLAPPPARALRGAGVALAGLAGFAAAGLTVAPRRFPPAPGARATPPDVSLPEGLPAPVERFFRARFGDRVPLIETVVVTGHGTVRLTTGLFDVPLPVRFRFTQVAGRSYRHYIEVTLFGLPVGRVNEWFVDGSGRAEVFGKVQAGPEMGQGANLGLWIEAFAWFPSVLVTDPRLHWEAVDDETAIVVVPFGATHERVLVRFDPADGDIAYWEMMRYANGRGDKRLYANVVWFDDGRPWASFRVDDIALNVPVDTSLGARGLP